MATKTGYKKLLLKAKELMGQAGLLAFDRAKLLTEVFNDRDFRADLGNADDWKAADALNEFCRDLALKFDRLRQLIEHFPDRGQWATGDLEGMLARMIEDKRGEEREANAPAAKVNRIKREEFEAVQQQVAHEQARAKHLESVVSAKREEIQWLREENAELKHKLAVAEGRLTELERLLDRQQLAA